MCWRPAQKGTITDIDAPQARTRAQQIGLWLGPALFLLACLTPPPGSLSHDAWRTAGLAIWMAVWWASEAAPIAATSLLPLMAIPILGVGDETEAAAPYANPIVLLLLAGSILALSIERWGLHRRIALTALSLAGDRPRAMLFGVMAACAVCSMWISNTATALMMTPIALSAAAAAVKDRDKFAIAMVLGVAYAATIGGLATPIGTPTNLIAMNWIRAKGEAGADPSFAEWMAIGLPVTLILLPAAWAVLALGMGPGVRLSGAGEEIARERAELGPISTPEWRVIGVFALVAGLWVFGAPLRRALDLPGLTDMAAAVIGAVAVLVLPAGRAGPGRPLLTWSEALRAPWGVILLFGAGISLAGAMERSGLALWLGEALGGLSGAPVWLLALSVSALVIVMTEFMSNVATITMVLPILAALATAAGLDPVALIVPAALASSVGFMMPAGTGPNAVAFSTGVVSVAGMIARGAIVNLIGLAALTLAGVTLAPLVLG